MGHTVTVNNFSAVSRLSERLRSKLPNVIMFQCQNVLKSKYPKLKHPRAKTSQVKISHSQNVPSRFWDSVVHTLETVAPYSLLWN